MRRLITFSLLFFSAFVVFGANQSDSIKVAFALNKTTFSPTHNISAVSMTKFIDGLTAAVRSGNFGHISVYGYASPDGPFLINDRLAIGRCNSVAGYLSREAGIPLDSISKFPGGVAWNGLYALVDENPDVPSRSAVLEILKQYLPDACTDQLKSEECAARLIALDEGRPYDWMLENLFPALRYARVVYTSHVPDSSTVAPEAGKQADQSDAAVSSDDAATSVSANPDDESEIPAAEDSALDSALTVDGDSANEAGSALSSSAAAEKPCHRLALKTNMLYDAVLVPNIEVEWRFNRKWTVALEGGGTSLGKYKNEKTLRLSMISPEVRRWFIPRGPWHGLYAGLFAGGAFYDYMKPGHGYYGDAVMGGLSVGYMWPISRSLSLEAAVGAGYLYTRCKEYIPLDGHHVYQRTKEINYFGPLKVKFSLVWRLWEVNKNRRSNDKTLVIDER